MCPEMNNSEKQQLQQKYFIKIAREEKVYMVVKVCRVFSGEHTETKNTFYGTPERAKDKQKSFTQKAAPLMNTLSEFQSIPFAYSVTKLSSTLKSWPCSLLSWFQLKSSMNDTQLLEMVMDDIEHGTDKFLQGGKVARTLNGTFEFTIKKISITPPFYGREVSKRDNSLVIPLKPERIVRFIDFTISHYT